MPTVCVPARGQSLIRDKVVKEGDDLMAATHYEIIMMLRFASTKAAYDKFRRPIEYPKIKYV